MKLAAWSCLALLVSACSSTDPGAPGPGAAGGASAGQGSGGAGAGAGTGSGGAGTGGGVSGSAGSTLGGSDGASAGSGGSSAVAGGGAGGSAGNGGSAGSAPIAEPALRWIGRVDRTANGAKLSWPGTGFMARFSGTGAHVSLKTNGVDYFQLVLDGKVSLLTTQAGTHVYDLAKNVTSGEHTVTLWRRTEPNNGVVEVGAVTFDGMLLAPLPAATKHLEIVGDSISVGFGVECKTQGEGFTFATENNYLTYQALTARKFGAELYTEAWSGIGMWRDVGGGTTASSQMPDRFLHGVPNDAASLWDFGRYTPDAVVVLLGTNDFAKGDPGQPFVDAYIAFVAGLRTRYPKARHYYAVSPMLGGTNRTAHKAYLGKVVTARNAASDMNVAIIEFAQPAADAWGCGHPNAAAHAIMAGVLQAALTKDLGW